ncbi:kinase-like domain-containing protein [Kickxella alabastrina]|uniref:kinase-like domain-containing protein n=1 Tax=Kickxella alabastrina TaxID=61397 RepID=UPI00222005ED|nr:kinase-like domain-containing protein [Kickxella alabastrina]KAI7833938.1 kinase-like domain-containing protein [Kickxella alabastrina]
MRLRARHTDQPAQQQQQQQQRGRHRGEEMTLCGTPSYISPEVLARLPYGSESDVWALGCLLVTLLTGTQPFGAVGRGDQITEDVVARQVRLPRTLSREARHLVFELLRVDPRERLRSEEILDHEFFASGKPEVPLQRIEDNAGRDRILPHADNALNAAALLGERILPQRHAGGAGRRPGAPALEPAPAPAPHPH